MNKIFSLEGKVGVVTGGAGGNGFAMTNALLSSCATVFVLDTDNMKIENAKFKKKVVPGDTIIFRLNLISPIRRGLCHMHGKGFVDGKIVVEGDL